VVLSNVLWLVLQPLTSIQNPWAESGSYNLLCADGNFRRCKLVSAAWLADCPDYCNLHHLEQHVCFWCYCPENKLGDSVPHDKLLHRWDHNLNCMLSNGNTKEADAQLSSRHVHRGFNMFRHIPCNVTTSQCPTSSIHCRFACLITSRSGFSTS